MEGSKNPQLDVFKLFQPELLSLEELVNILRERGVGPVLLSQSKEKLVSLFKRVALPLPQRELRDNYRGNLLKKLRRKAERIKIGDSSSSDSKGFTIGVSGSSTLSRSISEEDKSSCERLKPPPDLVNYDRKKIRLNSTTGSSETIKKSSSSNLDNVIIKKRKTSESSREYQKNINGITEDPDKSITDVSTVGCPIQSNNNREETDKISNGVKNKNVPCKKVSLKRNRFTTTSTPSPVAKPTLEKQETTMENTKPAEKKPEPAKEKSPSEPDKKRKLITWP